MDTIRARVLQTIRDHLLIESGDRIVVAVSGGADSVALLLLLESLKKKLAIDLIVAHYDHAQRSIRSVRDKEFTRALAERLKLDHVEGTLERGDFSERHGQHHEDALREKRYEFLREAASSVGATKIATAHTANDQLETILMRLLRGAGQYALTGIRYKRKNIIRPLLDCTRAAIIQFLKEANQTYCDDHTNRDLRHFRNVVRHCIVPELERTNPRIYETLAQSTELLSLDLRFIKKNTQHMSVKVENGESLLADTLSKTPKAIAYRIIKRFLIQKTGSKPSFNTVKATFALTKNSYGTKQVQLDKDTRLVREYNLLRIEKKRTAANGYRYDVTIPGETLISEIDTRIKSRFFSQCGSDHPGGAEILIDYKKIQQKLQVRTRLSGDKIILPHHNTPQKLKKIWIDRKIPLSIRELLPLIVDDERLVWAPGFGLSDVYAIDKETQQIVAISFETKSYLYNWLVPYLNSSKRNEH